MAFTPDLCHLIAGPVGCFTLEFGIGVRVLRHPFHIFFALEPFATQEPLNNAIAWLTATAKPTPRAWAGPVLVLKLWNAAHCIYMDFEAPDVMDIRAYFALCR